MNNFELAVEFVKKVKMEFVRETERGDMPPVVMMEQDDKLSVIAIAPVVDKHAGLFAVKVLCASCQPTAMTIVADAHIRTQKTKPGQTPEEAAAEFHQKYQPGEMQRQCDEEGACERGELIDVLSCIRYTRDGTTNYRVVPYDYHGKGGKPFAWLESHPQAPITHFDEPPGTAVGGDAPTLRGFIPDSLRAAFAGVPDINTALGLARTAFGLSGAEAVYCSGNAALKVLHSLNFDIYDLRTPVE